MKYLVVVEKSASGFGAYAPDLPGCIAVGQTRKETLRLMREAMDFHIEGLRENGDDVPVPCSSGELVEVGA